MADLTVDLFGVRGTLPTSQPEMTRYGGNTSCVLVQSQTRTLILDAGSGIVPLGRKLLADGIRDFDILITHAHYDHVIGLPFFPPMMRQDTTVNIWFAGCDGASDTQSLLSGLIRQPFLPFAPTDLPAKIVPQALPKSGCTMFGDVEVQSAPVNHPGGSAAFRVSAAGRSFVYVPDFEHDDGAQDAKLTAFLSNADLAVLDCTYTPEEYPDYKGFGHSHWQKCSQIATQANVQQWGVFHHAQSRSDDALDTLASQIKAVDETAFIAREGTRFSL